MLSLLSGCSCLRLSGRRRRHWFTLVGPSSGWGSGSAP